MNFFGKLILLLALAITVAVVRADELAMSGNPYATIAERNVFALVPIPTNAPVDNTPPADPPPKITPNGIMSLFGKLQVLFKVAVAGKAGQPAKDLSYVLGEGERQDEIEVIAIDGKKGIITFNNHGTVQELALVDAPKQSVPAPTGGGVGGVFGGAVGGGVPAPAAANGITALLGRGGRGRGAVGGANPTDASSPTPGLATAGGINPQTKEEQLSPEAQVIMIEANRLATQEAVDQGKMPPLPPTMLTPADATGHNGSPLIVSPEPLPVKKK